MSGFRLLIQPNDADSGEIRHFSGYSDQQPGSVFQLCPCCKNQLFPALNIDCSDDNIQKLGLWPPRYLNILFCPFCAFYMQPYWLHYVGDVIEISGGDTTSSDILQFIETPYTTTREVVLQPLDSSDDPTIPGIQAEFRRRTKEPGVYHQFGGSPIRENDLRLKCPLCSKGMAFAGILDYDDLNIPLYEDDHRPVALIIGDGDCLNFYTCMACNMVGLTWAY